MEFPKYPKTPRFSMGCLVTEKIDGTNAVILVESHVHPEDGTVDYTIRAGSRKRWITPENDNFGFAKFVQANEQRLIELLGPGIHYGEWYGQGIQRGYGLDHKRLALFDGPGRYPWALDMEQVVSVTPTGDPAPTKLVDVGDAKVGVVPLLYQGPIDAIIARGMASEAMAKKLKSRFLPNGSEAVPGWLATEGVIVQLRGSGGGQRFKIVWDK